MKKLSIVVVTILALGLGATLAKAIVFGGAIIDSWVTYPWVASVWFSTGVSDEYEPIFYGCD